MTWPSFLILLEFFLAFFFVYSFHAFLVSQRKMGTTLKQLAYVIWNLWLFRMKCDPYINLLSHESHERFAFITVKQFQVYFRSLQKPSRKWIQSISPPRLNVANKLAKVACTTCIPLSLKCGPFVRLFSRGIGQATSSLLSRFFRVSMLDSKDSKPNSIIDPWEDPGSRIESRSSTRKRLSTYTCPVL